MADSAATTAAAATPKNSWYRRLYLRVEGYATTKYALAAMLVVSVIDASFFPIPPFAIMVPMVLARPKSWWKLALLGTVASFGGGLLGYYLGSGAASFLSIDLTVPMGGRVAALFGVAGMSIGQILSKNFWFLALAASILPTPFKVVAIGSGMVGVDFTSFMLAAAIGRSVRFFLVGGVLAIAGPQARKWLRV